MTYFRFLFFKLNVWLALGSALMVVVSALALSIPLSAVGAGLLLPPLLFYFIYVEERRDVGPEDEINHPHRTALVRRYGRPLLATELVALIGYEGLLLRLVLLRPDVGVGHLALGQVPILVLGVYGHLKRHAAFDSLAVGGTWAFVIAHSLVVSTGQGVTRELGWVGLAWFLIAFAGVESRNVPDAEGDTRTDKTTLAGHLGRGPTTAVVGLLKATGVIIFWEMSGALAAGLCLGYLTLLRVCRTVTRREADRIEGTRRERGLDRATQVEGETQYPDVDRL